MVNMERGKNLDRVRAGRELQAKLRKSSVLRRKRVLEIKKTYSNLKFLKRLGKLRSVAYKKHPEILEKISSSVKRYWTPARRKQRAAKMREVYRKNPQLMLKIDKAVTGWWSEHPNIKREYAERVKKYFTENPAMFKKFLTGGRNASKLKLKTKQGFKVRSKPEKVIADYLCYRNIKADYERKTLILDGWLCTPDFFLPKYNCFLEYYGGHPKSWRKKVVKNRLYRKYKIPCVFLTPAELRDLDYYLLHSAKKLHDSAVCKKFNLQNFH